MTFNDDEPLLGRLQAMHAFDPAPLRSGLHGFHVPFDQILGGQATEAGLSRAIKAMERVAVVGRSGVGKTSVIWHVLDPLSDEYAAVRVPVAAEDEETITSPQRFAEHLLGSVARQLRDARLIDDRTRTAFLQGGGAELTLTARRSRQVGLGFAKWLLNAEVTSQMEGIVTSTARRGAAEVLDQAGQVVDVLARMGWIPVIVIDDSDAWLRTSGGDRRSFVGPFFGGIIRLLAEELSAALVVAVHEDYLEMAAFKDSAGFLEQHILVPRLPTQEALAYVVAARVGAITGEVAHPSLLKAVMEDEALAVLFTHYAASTGSLRRVLLIVHSALQLARDDESDVITAGHIAAAGALDT